jgi:hypothetical protein
MIRIQKLTRPNKKSGDNLTKGKTFKKRGLVITNASAGPNIWVDEFAVKPKKKKKPSKK